MSRLGFWKMIPISRRTAAGSRRTSRPAMRYSAGGGGQGRGQDGTGGCLASPVWAEQGEELARPNHEADPVDGIARRLPLPFDTMLDLQHGETAPQACSRTRPNAWR